MRKRLTIVDYFMDGKAYLTDGKFLIRDISGG